MQVARHLLNGFSGLGVANCPSLEQLQGITDTMDPCQNPALLTAPGAPGASVTCPSGLVVVADQNGNYSCPPVASGPTSPTLPSGIDLSTLPLVAVPTPGQPVINPGQANLPVQMPSSTSTWLIYGGVAIVALVLISSIGGGRRR
jgi:hypothetical protein